VMVLLIILVLVVMCVFGDSDCISENGGISGDCISCNDCITCEAFIKIIPG
jgi:hypothetical protein